MAVTPKRARELALSLAETSETPHFDRIAFRTPRKIFATLANDGRDLNLMFDAAHQEHFCEQAPKAFSPVPGGWGKNGATRCDLKQIDAATLLSALKTAHTLAAPKLKMKRAPKPRG